MTFTTLPQILQAYISPSLVTVSPPLQVATAIIF
jgi:hypothetical protein